MVRWNKAEKQKGGKRKKRKGMKENTIIVERDLLMNERRPIGKFNGKFYKKKGVKFPSAPKVIYILHTSPFNQSYRNILTM